MSTSAVASSSLSHQLQQYFQTRQGDLRQLGQALSSGDLSGAQSAFSTIVSLGKNGPFGGQPFKITQREQDFSAVGQALRSGDLGGAQQAFAALQQTFHQKFEPSAPTPASAPVASSAGSTPTSGPEIILNLSNSGSSSSNPEQISINIANSAQGEQVSLSVGNQGSKPQEFTFNLAPNSNEQIVLNLLGAPSTTGAGAASSGASSSNSSSNPSAGGALSVSA